MNHIRTGAFAGATVGRFLARLMRHSDLDPQDQQAILRLSGQVAQIDSGHDIVRPNTTTAHSHIVIQGIVERFNEAKNGARAATALFVPGDMCGLESVEAPTVSWGLSAFTPCRVIHIAHDDLKQLSRAHPAIRRAFWKEMAIDASIQSTWTANAVLKNSLARTAHLLCELALRMEQAGFNTPSAFALKTTQTQLAVAVGLTSVHMNRVLRELRLNDLISTDGRTITVRNWPGLCEVAEFDPRYLD